MKACVAGVPLAPVKPMAARWPWDGAAWLIARIIKSVQDSEEGRRMFSPHLPGYVDSQSCLPHRQCIWWRGSYQGVLGEF